MRDRLPRSLALSLIRVVLITLLTTACGDGGGGPTITPSAAVLVSPALGQTSETGDTTSFEVVLNTAPDDLVTLRLMVNDDTEAALMTPELIFTPDNWFVPQPVIVRGIDDALADGPTPFAVVFGAVESNDADYAGLQPNAVSVLNADDDSAGLILDMLSTDRLSEGGDPATLGVSLSSEPAATVTLTPVVDPTDELAFDPPSLTFDAVNWRDRQELTITSVQDGLLDGEQLARISFILTSDDVVFQDLVPTPITIVSMNTDVAGATATPSTDMLSESGPPITLEVVLTAQPTADVTLNASTSNLAEIQLDINTLTFTADDWSTPQIITVTSIDDGIRDGDQTVSVNFSALQSTDTNFDGRSVDPVALTNIDDGSICGDGVVDTQEECDDGDTITNACVYSAQRCLVCGAGCVLTPGTTSFCGDRVIDTDNGEACDGDTLDGRDCISEGFSGGTLTCTTDCSLDTTGCTP